MKTISTLILAASLFLISYFIWSRSSQEPHPLHSKEKQHAFVIAQAHHLIGFDLVDPEQAPLDERDSVMRGYRLIMNTPFYAPNYARDQLSCTNCHFTEGDSLGGKNGGISLVGVTTVYPRYSARFGKVISLTEKINSCFERSLSGNPLPVDSQEVKDIIAYLSWISKEVEHIKPIPWLGLAMLNKKSEPNPQKGATLYQMHCALCHRENGQGGAPTPTSSKTIPPLWGPNSFNDSAGMNQIPMFASFIYWNMPHNDPILTEQEAWDIASFVTQQPRPHYHPRIKK